MSETGDTWRTLAVETATKLYSHVRGQASPVLAMTTQECTTCNRYLFGYLYNVPSSTARRSSGSASRGNVFVGAS